MEQELLKLSKKYNKRYCLIKVIYDIVKKIRGEGNIIGYLDKYLNENM